MALAMIAMNVWETKQVIAPAKLIDRGDIELLVHFIGGVASTLGKAEHFTYSCK